MSISATLSSALSGLTAAARAAEIVSSNVANAQVEGYARRELQVAPRAVGAAGQGVQVVGVTRITDRVLTGDRRLAEAAAAGAEVRAGFQAGIEALLGSPEVAGSLTARIADFDAALIAAASRPDADTRLAAVAEAAVAVTRGLAAASDGVQAAREQADGRIAAGVGRISEALAGVAALNRQIIGLSATGRDVTGLQDQRQRLIDGIAAQVPLREVDRGGGAVALYTANGATLVEGTRSAQLGFTATPVIAPGMAVGAGLSGLTLDGRAVGTGPDGLLGGGALAADFAVRDRDAPQVQAQLDALALELSSRFGAGGPDATISPGQPGLFTDGGAVTVNVVGLAGRLALNAAADPAQGGALFRLRDGLGAAAPGATGDATLLVALQAALTAPREPASASLPPGARGVAAMAGQVASGVAQDRLSAETEASFASARSETLRTLERAGGVDTDVELQNLLVIEKAWAANAQVLRTVDEMMSLLLGIGR